MSTLHKRYDWKRTVFVASLNLTFFLGSQSSSLVHEVDAKEFAKGVIDTTHPVVNKKYIRSFEINSDYYFNIARR